MDPKTGGISHAIQTLIKGVSKMGVENEVACLDGNEDPVSNKSFPIHILGPGKWGVSYSSKMLPWLVDNLYRFDSVVIHGLWQYHSFAIFRALRILERLQKAGRHEGKKRPRIFVMPHGMLDPYFQRAKERRIKALRNWVYWKLIEGLVVNRADALFFTCEEERILAHEPFRPYLPKREVVVGLGIECPPKYSVEMRNEFAAVCPEVKGGPYILFLSRIDRKKGVDILIKAYNNFAEQTKGTATKVPKLIVAGPGIDSSYGRSVMRLVENNPVLKQNVFFPGMLMGDVKWGAFYGCEAFVLPSHQENFGIAVVEALACRKPVLISRQVNIWREVVADGGGLVAEDTVEGMEALLKKWLSLSLDERTTMGNGAHLSYKNFFTVTNSISKFSNAISAL
jgi:glycosyltransferase involved in cell wall biosynthesis